MTNFTLNSSDMMASILSCDHTPMAKRQFRLWLKLKWFKRRQQQIGRI